MYPALLHKKLYGSRAYLWVQDLWPESVAAAGKMDSSAILKGLTKMVRSIYQESDGVLVQSEAFIPSVLQKGILPDKIHYIPNWAEDIFTNTVEENSNKYREIIPE